MDLRFVQSPDVTPLLVKLYDSHKLYTLAGDKRPQARAALTDAVSELLGQETAPRERELVSDVLIGLMRQAELDLRQALAERLAQLPDAPLRVILHLVNDDSSVAAPILRESPVLSDLDLLYIIKAKSAAYWQTIAARANLGEGVVNALAETREPGTAHILAGNENTKIGLHAANILGQMAEQDETLARPLLSRPDLPAEIARHLYRYVGEELRNHIRNIFGEQGEQANRAIADVLVEFSDERKGKKFMPTESMLEAANAMAESGQLTTKAMLAPLQRGQIASFIALFAKFSGLTPEKTHTMLEDGTGRMLAITCRALGLGKGELSRIYLLTQRLRSTERIVDHQELLRAMAAFDAITLENARTATNIHHPFHPE